MCVCVCLCLLHKNCKTEQDEFNKTKTHQYKCIMDLKNVAYRWPFTVFCWGLVRVEFTRIIQGYIIATMSHGYTIRQTIDVAS